MRLRFNIYPSNNDLRIAALCGMLATHREKMVARGDQRVDSKHANTRLKHLESERETERHGSQPSVSF